MATCLQCGKKPELETDGMMACNDEHCPIEYAMSCT